MTKIRSVLISVLWAVIVIAFPVASGVIVVISKADPTASRLVQASFMAASIAIPLLYCKIKRIPLREIFLLGIDRAGIRSSLWYLPLVVVLVPMIVGGLDLGNTGYVLATLLFTLTVGVAEELYFRGIILRQLGKTFGPVAVVFISVAIFGFGHASAAFVETNPALVVLTIVNAFLFGWVAAEVVLLTKNLLPLMVFHGLFDFLTYQMMATGSTLILAYAVRGTLMALAGVYLLAKLRQRSQASIAAAGEPLKSPLARSY